LPEYLDPKKYIDIFYKQPKKDGLRNLSCINIKKKSMQIVKKEKELIEAKNTFFRIEFEVVALQLNLISQDAKWFTMVVKNTKLKIIKNSLEFTQKVKIHDFHLKDHQILLAKEELDYFARSHIDVLFFKSGERRDGTAENHRAEGVRG